ncbi:tetrathionate respiration response regulator TtrR [Atlantibacter hermannii]|uniref:tetrathionate respiration response regulator TtrR n=1 Tax=Atlantibacter hermannii TaxID=565 RepID=UPI00289B7833|nr:tetrathionate respiration response regulator TtrR [Atlantibacter hermannii]
MSVVHLVDDDVAVTEACQFLLEGVGYAVQRWNDSQAFLAGAALYEEGVALLDLRMPHLDGHGLYSELLSCRSTLAVIFLTGHGDLPVAVEQMKRGAVDFLQKPVSADALIAAIERARTTSAVACQRRAIEQRFDCLTPKEREIARLIVQGLMNREIADRLSVAVRTVEVHRARVMEKMEAVNIAELVGKMRIME